MLLALAPMIATAQTPHVTGEITTNPAQGLLAGNVCLSNLPPGDTLRFLLHNGLNVRSIHDSAGRPLSYSGYYDGRMLGEGLEYTVVNDRPGRRTLCVGYTGAFPVYPEHDNSYDFKGAIAFTGRTVRAAEQAKWYPVLYDSASARLFDVVTYQLHVSCSACTATYISGSAPAQGPQHDFASTVPRQLLLFAGDYPTHEVAGIRYLNSTASKTEMQQISRGVAMIQQHYERMLAVPFRDSITLVESIGLDQNRGHIWGFATWPAIVFSGMPFAQLATGLTAPDTTTDWVLGFLAHELAHYYFGTRVHAVGMLQGFFIESTAEYMSLRAVREFHGDNAYRVSVQAHAHDALELSGWVPLDRMTRDQMTDPYRYRYASLLFVALERQFGTARIDRLLHNLLETAVTDKFDYDLFRRAAIAAGIPQAEWTTFEARCIHPAPAASCIASMATTNWAQ